MPAKRVRSTLPNTPGRKAAQKRYNAKPAQVKRRASRNKARAIMVKAGAVRKGDGKDVDHRNGNPLKDNRGNLRVQTKSQNRQNNHRKGNGHD